MPSSFIKKFGSRKFSVSIRFVVSDLSTVETTVFAHKQSLIALSYPIVEASLINRTIIINHSSKTMWKSIFPLTFVISTERKQIVEL